MSSFASLADDGRVRPVPALPDQDSGPQEGGNALLALALMRASPDSVYLMSTDGRVDFVNRAGIARQGQSLPCDRDGPRHGTFLWELWPDADRRSLNHAMDAAMDGESSELVLRCPDAGGGSVACNVTVAPVEDQRGGVARLLCIARDC